MDNIAKLLKKLRADERVRMEKTITQVLSGNLARMDVKKLKGRNDIFRVRAGSLRIIFKKEGSLVTILSIERRSDITYK